MVHRGRPLALRQAAAAAVRHAAYVVDAYRRGKSEDVYLIPVAIAYDQIQDVGSYVAEQRGGAK